MHKNFTVMVKHVRFKRVLLQMTAPSRSLEFELLYAEVWICSLATVHVRGLCLATANPMAVLSSH